MRVMYDSVTAGCLPADATLVAAYADGRFANVPAVRKRCPKALVVVITVMGGTADANVVDCEKGDTTPASAAAWAKHRVSIGKQPTIYCNAETWPAVKVEVGKLGIARQVSYWVAQWDGRAVLPAGAVAKQYRSDTAQNLDYSVVAPFWPGVDPPVKAAVKTAPKKTPAKPPAKTVPVPAPVPHLTAQQWTRLQKTSWWQLILRWLRIHR